jgi:glutathionylspermidine synthase
MQPIKISRRPRWRQHIQDNAYQADVLSDLGQQYWVEALPQPFAIQFTPTEETVIAEATEALWAMCVEFLDWFFDPKDDAEINNRLALLKIRPEYWQALKNSWHRTDPVEDLTLATRFDLVVTEDGRIKLIEINGETPLLGAETVYQWNWLVDYQRNHSQSAYPLPQNASQFNEYWERTAGQWRRIREEYNLQKTGISFLVDEQLEEDAEMAMQLIQILHDEVDANIYTQLVYLRGLKDDRGQEIQRGLGLDEEGYFIDQVNERIPILWKIYDWSDLQNDMANAGCSDAFAKQLAIGEMKVIEPLWKQILSNKGAIALMWQQFQDSDYAQYLLPTYFDHDLSPEATQLLLNLHVKKPLLGMEGMGTSIELGGGSLETREMLGYGAEGFILQEYIELPQAFDYYYVVGSWVIDDTAAGIILRGDRQRITGRHCLIIPHIVAEDSLAFL